MLPLSRLGCPLSLKTPNMGNVGLGDCKDSAGTLPCDTQAQFTGTFTGTQEGLPFILGRLRTSVIQGPPLSANIVRPKKNNRRAMSTRGSVIPKALLNHSC